MKSRKSGYATVTRAAFVVLICASTAAVAVGEEDLTAQDRSATVARLATAVEEGYVLESEGREFAASLRAMAAADRFNESNAEQFAEALQSALREISGDLHFRVSAGGVGAGIGGPKRRMVRVPAGEPGNPPPGSGPRVVRVPSQGAGQPVQGGVRIATEADRDQMPDEMTALFNQMSARFPDNYRSSILAGNVGILEIDILFPPHDRLAEAMTELAGTDALILDLRSCPGGTGMTTRPLESVFFDEPTELVTMAIRGQEPTAIMSTDETPGGVKYLGKPVYILTSAGTGSACEEVAWCLKYHGKAILVGENTAGAGHGITGIVDLGHGLSATVPSMLPMHPHFDGGWEAIGVPPDVTIGQRSAADQAHLLALGALMEDADERRLRELESIYAATSLEIGRRQRGYADQGLSLRSYSISFEHGRRLFVQDGQLYYIDDSGRSKGPLVAMDKPDHFELASGIQQLVVKVERDEVGEVRAIAVSRKGSDDWERFRRVSPI